MANEQSEENTGLRAFVLSGRYDEVGPELGRLYEARHRATGRPALALLPGAHVDWTPEGDWTVSLFYKRSSSSMTLRVDEAPPLADPAELGNLLALTDAAFQRVEEHPRLAAHLASGSAPRSWQTSWMPAFVGLMGLVLGCGGWMYGADKSQSLFSNERIGAPSEVNARFLGSARFPVARSPAYPLPDKPFKNQQAAPCDPKLDEIEINGGCWLALKRRPPCLDSQAEYQGVCYLPNAKHPGRPPQSAKP